MEWTFEIQCMNCGEKNERPITLTLEEKFDAPGTRGTFNFIMKCKLCGRQGTINYVEDTFKTYENSEEKEAICSFDIRGCDITNWIIGGDYNVQTESGKVFNSVDLSEGDWCEFDEDLNEVVGVYEVETSVVSSSTWKS